MGNFFLFYPNSYSTTNILVYFYFYDNYKEAVVRELIKYVQCIMKLKEELFLKRVIQRKKATFIAGLNGRVIVILGTAKNGPRT